MYAELERKICTKCRIEKEIACFSKRSARPTGKACWCKDCLNEWRRENKKKDAQSYQEYEFIRGLRRNYGITANQYHEMLAAQNESCACCGQHKSKFKRRLHVDHDHDTGEIRALLCTECNPALGYFKHSIERLELGISYLRKFKK